MPQWFTAGPDSSVEVVVSEHGSERMAVTDAVALGTMAALVSTVSRGTEDRRAQYLGHIAVTLPRGRGRRPEE